MTRRIAYLSLAIASMLVLVGLVVFVFHLGVLADSSTEDVSVPLWAIAMGIVALTAFIVGLLRWGTIRAAER